ncbi:RibD family protein [Amorphus orientalis]|uniref:Riboflavin-specific deaminase-like protein n=1 Tax=Amorphus orientalis TaxID=649198 RepID=A0AAE3VPY0_9HYPH|nr:dihydrofolate reductase family protein [Amorphus orientalis]MDQ0315995.1 riboflavin-specific deaminase-like protein [Amorphus orientalis]
MTTDRAPLPTDDGSWASVLSAARDGGRIAPEWQSLFAPIIGAGAGKPFVIGQLGQSLDGRVATSTGQSRYINGPDCLNHLHRLRALVDVVIVGVGTVIADDPRLTVRLVDGPSPVRVVIDPRGRIPRIARMFSDASTDIVVITQDTGPLDLPSFVKVVRLPGDGKGRIDPKAIREVLFGLGYRRMLVEGGPNTVSAFLEADALDRLHLLVAPVIIGAGPAGVSLAPTDALSDARRPVTTSHRLGDEIVFDCDLRRQQAPISPE